MINIDFNGLNIQHICKPKLKHSYLSIDKKSNIILKTPKVSQHFIEDLLIKKESWLRAKIKEIQNSETIELSLDGINNKESIELLRSRVDYFTKKMGLKYNELKFRKMKSRWGSCNSKRVITLNKKLVKTPSECIDYVVVHELAHLVHMNHSKQFHDLVDRYIPDAKSAKKTLSMIVFNP